MPTKMWPNPPQMFQLFVSLQAESCCSRAPQRPGDPLAVVPSPSPSPSHFTSWLLGSPGSAGCYPLAAVTMRVAVLAELVGPVLARSLVGGESLRAGSVDRASHEHLLEVPLSVLQRASSRYRPSERPVLPRCRPAALWKSHWLSTTLS